MPTLNLSTQILPNLPPPHRHALHLNLVGQLLGLLFGAVLLDGGVMGRFVLVGTIAYWCVSLIILIRRYSKLTRFDLLFFQFGFLLAMLLAVLLQPFIARILGN